jgi:glycosyltransferase involved in cell wall biosynthesis
MPSLSEGFGLVSLEAMAAGLPVITTVNTNATDIIEDGIEGYIIPIRDTQAIVSALEKILSLKEEEFIEMSKSARMKALDFTWDNYQLRVEKYLNFKW